MFARSSCTVFSSNGSPGLVFTTDRMRSVGTWTFPETETETTFGASAAIDADGARLATIAKIRRASRSARARRSISRYLSFVSRRVRDGCRAIASCRPRPGLAERTLDIHGEALGPPEVSSRADLWVRAEIRV